MKPFLVIVSFLTVLSAAASAATFRVTVLKDDATIRRFHTAIVTAGHECDSVKLAFTEGVTPNGDLFMIYCGIKVRNSGRMPPLLYRIVKIGNDPLIVIPW